MAQGANQAVVQSSPVAAKATQEVASLQAEVKLRATQEAKVAEAV